MGEKTRKEKNMATCTKANIFLIYAPLRNDGNITRIKCYRGS